MAATKIQLITKGPSKYDLSLGLFDRKQVNMRSLQFTTSEDLVFDVVVTGVDASEDTGEAWRITGRTRSRERVPGPPHRVFIVYSTESRTGSIKFLD